jgi:Fe-S oxidoreductase/nitrate reductase gamma subunit
MPVDPIRQTFLNIPEWAEVALYLGSVVSIAVLVWGLARRVKPWKVEWKKFSKQFVLDIVPSGIEKVLVNVFGQKRLLRKGYGGTMHFGLFWGFVLLFIGTVLATLDWDFGHLLFNSQFLRGAFYLGYELVLDIAGLAFIATLLMALYRRAVPRPSQLTYRKDFPVTLWSLLIIAVTGFLIEGLRIAGLRPIVDGVRQAVFVPPWGAWSPVGYVLSGIFVGMPVELRENLHLGLWLFHAAIALAWIAQMSWNENAEHILVAPLNTFFAQKKSPPPTLVPIKLEEVETFGVSKLEEFTWQQRMSFDTCTMCGRCEAACPAFMQGTPLSPKRVILKLRDHMHSVATLPTGVERQTMVSADGGVIHPDELFSCTTCMACVRECPVFIPIVDIIVDMRRYLTLSEGAIPTSAQGALRNTTSAGNPWGQAQADRAKWTDGLGVKTMAEAQEVEVLYWVGCAGSYDSRNQKVARAVVKLLQAAKVSFAILGKEEKCVGDWQRRMGEEYLFQTLALENIETLKQYKFKTVLAHCPHCFNTLKNDYPQFGGDFEVVHHSQFVARLIGEGRLKLTKPLADPNVTFHDSCYLGRYNGEFDAPRQIIQAIPGVAYHEMERSRSNGLCCGGGGGQMWMEPLSPKGTKKVNAIRLEEVQATGAKTVGTACSFCTIMMEDAVATKGAQEQVRIRDIAELALEAL